MFTVKHTNIIKGIATLMLLWHHLFYTDDILKSINNSEVSAIVAYFLKVCVAIFLILSGYGLTESYKSKKLKKSTFYKKNLKKLYLNFWFIWLAFVPIGIIFFDRSLKFVYGENIVSKLILNLLGIQRIFNFHGYNPTWWFMGLIIGLYLIYPFIFNIMDKRMNIMLIGSFILLYVPSYKILGLNIIWLFGGWLFPFVLGIYLSKSNSLLKVARYNMKSYKKISILLILLCFCMIYRIYGILLTNQRIDGIFGLLIILLIYIMIELVGINNKILRFLEYIGLRSFDIFLFHTFIYYYYFTNFIYSFDNDIMKFMVLVIICLSIAEVLNFFKLIIRKYSLIKKIK